MKFNQKSMCRKCGRAIWWRKTGTGSYLNGQGGVPTFNWCARRGSKPAPIACPDGGHHRPPR